MYKHKHIGSYGLIIKDEKIVLIRKGRGAYTGKLDLPGGSFEHGETPEETVIREIKEELGRDVISCSLFDANSCRVEWYVKQRDDIEDLHHIGFFYKIEIDNDLVKSDEDGFDSLGAAWYNINELKEDDVSPLTWIELQKLGYK